MSYDFTNFKNEIKKIEDWLVKEYQSLHTGIATPSVLDGVSVDVYGARQPVSHVASIDIEDAKTLFVNPWDKSAIKEIEKSINNTNLGLSVSANDQGVRVSFPDLSAERRVSLVKIMKSKLEDAKVSLRKEREKVLGDMDKMEKDKEISEDEKFSLKDELQKKVDEANLKLDEISARKEVDIMG
jgi:ribosome recycling factor